MRPLRVLITENALGPRVGTALWVRDVAFALLARGHTPIAFSPDLGAVAEELRAATVPVVDRLDALAAAPDVIHGQHHLAAMTALLRFPDVPAVYVYHGWAEAVPRFPRIRRYVTVDHTCRDRLLFEYGVPEARVRVVLNFADLARFRRRAPLPPRPRTALVFSNWMDERTHVPPVREACRQHGIALDVVGARAGTASDAPETLLGRYDLVFAKGRAAIEALAVGAAVVLCDVQGVGPLVTAAELPRLRPLNFGHRLLAAPLAADVLAREIARYDAADAARVTDVVRAEAGIDPAVDALVALYEETIAEHQAVAFDGAAELRAVAEYLGWLGPFVHRWTTDLATGLEAALGDRDRILADRDRIAVEERRLRLELDGLRRSRTVRLRDRVLALPLVGAALRAGRRAARTVS
jgi:hypothetical protein